LRSGTGSQICPGTSTGTGGLTAAGGGNLVLTGTTPYTGATTLDGGTLTLGSAGGLGSGALQLTAGTLRAGGAFPANTPLTLRNAVTLANSAVGFAGPNTLIFS